MDSDKLAQVLLSDPVRRTFTPRRCAIIPSRHRFSIVIAVGALLFCRTEYTHACSIACPQQLRAPKGPVPADALAIPLFDLGTVVQVVGPIGPVVMELDATSSVLRPTEELTPGPHTLTYDRHCINEASHPVAVGFDVTGPAPPPTIFGTLEPLSAGAFGTTGVYVRSALELDVAMVPFLGLLDVRKEVDGMVISGLNVDDEYALTLTTTCLPVVQTAPIHDSCGEVMSVTQGQHRVSFVPTVAGLGSLPALTTDVRLDCKSLSPTPPAAPGCAVSQTSVGTLNRTTQVQTLVLAILVVGTWFARRRRS